jgi:hypothetical protein
VFNEWYFQRILVFLDDTLIYSKYEEEHEKHLSMVLQVLREHQLFENLSKCSFYQRQIHYLGYVISKKRIIVDPKKIKSIEGWPTPRHVSEVRSFMELAGYYKIFIEGLSKIAHSITYLQKKSVKFEWKSDCEKSFQHLKYVLTSDPILRIVDPNEDFIVCIDACKEGLGGILSQNGHVI